MAKFITLCDMNEGEQATVQQLCLTGSIRRRLQDLGLIEGTTVVCCKKAPSGSPIAYWFRGTVIALRDADARLVQVQPVSHP